MWFTRLCIRYPVFTCMIMLVFVVMGIFSWQRLPVEEYPNVDIPYVMITTDYPGATPKVIESDITRPLENAVNTVSGVKRIISKSYNGFSKVAVQFNLGTPINAATQRVRDKIAQVKTHFNDAIKPPLVERIRLDQAPVLSLAFHSKTRDMTALSTYLKQHVIPRLQGIAGAGRVALVGGQQRTINIHPNPTKMAALGIGINTITQALKADNTQIPVGSLKQQATDLSVEVSGRFATPQDFAKLVVAKREQGAITLGQVAQIEDGAKDLSSLALLNGKRAVGIDVIKSTGANILSLVDAVKARLPAIRHNLPPGVSMQLVADSSKAIRASLHEVKTTLFEGIALTIVIIFLFLGSWRSTIITGLTLPVALAGTLFFLYVFGLSLNNMTLMAMSLSIGLLIDDAIVVRENIVRHAALGKSHFQAALDGTKEIGLAVLATTLTIVAVFLPVAFMGGIIGRFFYQFGIAIACAVLLSMLVSFTLDPMLSSRWRDPDADGIRGNSLIARGVKRFQHLLERLTAFYTVVIHWALRHRRSVMAIATLSLMAAFVAAGFVGKEFVPPSDNGELSVKFSTPAGSSLMYAHKKSQQISQILLNNPAVTRTYTTINTGMQVGKNQASIRLQLLPKAQRQHTQHAILTNIRHALQPIYGVQIESVAPVKGSLNKLKPIQLSLEGTDIHVLKQIGQKFSRQLAQVPGLVDLESSAKATKPMLAVHIDRQRAADLGLSVSQIGRAIRPWLAGDAVTDWLAPNGEVYDVAVQLPKQGRRQLSDLTQLPFSVIGSSGHASTITLGQVAQFNYTQGAEQINRRNLFREVLFSANVKGRPAGDVMDDVKAIIAQTKLPTGNQIVIQGASNELQQSIHYAGIALLLAILLIYMVLASQFNSFLQPLTIMCSLPLSLVGVFFALWICHSSLNLFSIIGIITLMGLVTKNAILLVDFIQQGTRDGLPLHDAIAQAGQVRLRPILMTTAAMIAGMLPLALGIGAGGEARAPMAHAIIGGLLSSTLLTLVVVPVVYSYLHDLKSQLQQWLHRTQQAKTKSVLSLAYSADSITPLDDDDEKPAGKDYVGMWYTARLRHGIDDKILFGVYKKHQTSPNWYSISHQYYDALGAMADKLAPLSGSPLTDGLPTGRDTTPPSFADWRKASRLPADAPRANPKWRSLEPSLKKQKAPLPTTQLLNKNDTQRIQRNAKLAGVSTTVWVLWAADRALRTHLINPDAVTSWVYPVNLRGATDCPRDSMNQCGGFMITIDNAMSAHDVYQQTKRRLTRLDHWMQWWLMTIGRWIRQPGINLLYRLLRYQPGQYTGSYTNIGEWDIPVLDGLTVSAPCAASHPISIASTECNGKRSLSVRLHPVVSQEPQVARETLALWRQLLLQDNSPASQPTKPVTTVVTAMAP